MGPGVGWGGVPEGGAGFSTYTIIPSSAGVKPTSVTAPHWVAWACPQPGGTGGSLSLLPELFLGHPHTGMWRVVRN